MSYNSDRLVAPTDQGHDDYIRALEVLAEVSGIIIEEKAERYEADVIEQAETLTFEHAPERASDEAKTVAYNAAVRMPKEAAAYAGWLTHKAAPDRAVEEANAIAYRYGGYKEEDSVAEAQKILAEIAAAERPRRPNGLELADLVPGKRVVVLNDGFGKQKQEFAKHEVVVSEPYEKEPDAEGRTDMVVKARRVDDHATDEIPLDSEEGVREVALEAWGVVPNSYGFYRQNLYLEHYGIPDGEYTNT